MNYTDVLMQIARERHAQTNVMGNDTDGFKTFHIATNANDYYVWMNDYEGEFLPTDLDVKGLYREIYGDPLDSPEAARIRAQEIIRNLEWIMDKKGVFHPVPSLFNKQRGYIEMPIDGKKIKITQKQNFFHFPVATEA